MTTIPPNPIDSVQVPQVVGLSPEVAFNVVAQVGLAPMYQVQQRPGRPLPGVATQWGQTPATFAGHVPVAGQLATHVVAQSPLAGAWVPRGSVVYLEWAEILPLPRKSSGAGWFVAAVAAVVLVLAGILWLVSADGGEPAAPSESPVPTATVTGAPLPGPTVTETETATATQTEPVVPLPTP